MNFITSSTKIDMSSRNTNRDYITWGPLDPKIWGGGAESMKESDSYLELSNKSIIDTAEFTFI